MQYATYVVAHACCGARASMCIGEERRTRVLSMYHARFKARTRPCTVAPNPEYSPSNEVTKTRAFPQSWGNWRCIKALMAPSLLMFHPHSLCVSAWTIQCMFMFIACSTESATTLHVSIFAEACSAVARTNTDRQTASIFAAFA